MNVLALIENPDGRIIGVSSADGLDYPLAEPLAPPIDGAQLLARGFEPDPDRPGYAILLPEP